MITSELPEGNDDISKFSDFWDQAGNVSGELVVSVTYKIILMRKTVSPGS